MGAICSICSNPSARALIDGALLSGERPGRISDKYSESLGVSRSAIYRHSRGGHVKSKFTPSYLGDRTVGETITDLAAIARRCPLRIGAGRQAADHDFLPNPRMIFTSSSRTSGCCRSCGWPGIIGLLPTP